MKGLQRDLILTNQDVATKEAAIRVAGQLLVNAGAVEEPYVDSMLERDKDLSVYMGNFVAIPHGTPDGEQYINKTAISIAQFPMGVNFAGPGEEEKIVTLVFGIAGLNGEHLELLSNIAIFASDLQNVAKLSDETDVQTILEMLGSGEGRKAVHFGAGNIGRGFIGETLHESGFDITFVDVNKDIINALNDRGEYTITLAAEGEPTVHVDGVSGINNMENPDAVVAEIANAELVTTAIGPNILPRIAPLIAQGIEKRFNDGIDAPLDVIAAENMVGGSEHLREYVYEHLNDDVKAFADKHVGFPNSAVDRIVPQQHHEDPLAVTVEKFKEWVIDETGVRNDDIRLKGVHYVDDLLPFIERKLFSVNTGHATTAYTGASRGYTTIQEALQDRHVKVRLEKVLAEIRSLLLDKWDFNEEELEKYHKILVERFINPRLSDSIARVARTPIRKLGYDERFIRPIRELQERGLEYDELVKVVATMFYFDQDDDDQSVEIMARMETEDVHDLVMEFTGLEDEVLVDEIVTRINLISNNVPV